MIRGKRLLAGAPGFDGLSFSDFLDMVWAELWNDCPAMGDLAKYRDIVKTVFIDGEEWEDERDPNEPHDPTKPIPKKALDALAEMRERIQNRETDAE